MKVSIITPFYKGNNYIEAYQDNMLSNIEHLSEDDEMEVIIVNDSPWEAVALRGSVVANPAFKVVKNRENSGIHLSRIHGLMQATGDYVIFLDQDDRLKDDAVCCFIEEAKRLIAKDPGKNQLCYKVIVANALLEQKDWKSLWYRTNYHKSVVSNLETYLSVGTQIISPGQCLIPKCLIPDFWLEHIITKNGADDYFLWLLLLEQGIGFSYLDKPLYVHAYTEKNLSADTSVTDESCYEFIEMLRGYEDIMPAKDLDRLYEMLYFKNLFRQAGKMQKLRLAFKNLKILLPNLVFKIKTKTGYGFNR